MQNEILGAEEMGDGGDIRAVAADHDHGVLDAVQLGQGALELAMERPLAAYHAAGRNRGAVAVNRRRHRGADLGMAGEPEVVVVGEVDVFLAVDGGRVARQAIVNSEIWVLEGEGLRCAQNVHRHRMVVEKVMRFGDRVATAGTIEAGLRSLAQQPLRELPLFLGREARDGLTYVHYAPAPSLDPLSSSRPITSSSISAGNVSISLAVDSTPSEGEPSGSTPNFPATFWTS